MRIIARRALREFWENNPDSEDSLESWFAEAEKAHWKNPNEVKEQYGKASILKEGRVVFNICGNTYRLLVWMNYGLQLIYIKWIGTHEEYDNLNMEDI